jgi:Fibronectin type III domain
MGSAAMDKDGNLAIGYSVSNSLTFPAIRFTGRLANDALNTLTVAESDLRQGTGSQTHTSGRWGDYSMLAVDPTDGCTFWYTTEYYDAGASSAGWSTSIGSFKLGNCGGAPPSPPSAPSGLTATAVSSAQIDLSWTDNSNNETQFAIDRCLGVGCTFAQLATVGPDVTTYADQSLAASTTYTYQVRALNGTVSSDPSASAQATTQAGQQPPPEVVMHVASLAGTSAPNGKSGWRATVTITVKDANGGLISNATVAGSWSSGNPASGSCVTGTNGSCSVTSAKLTNGTQSVTLTITGVTHPTATYNASANVASSITVNK